MSSRGSGRQRFAFDVEPSIFARPTRTPPFRRRTIGPMPVRWNQRELDPGHAEHAQRHRADRRLDRPRLGCGAVQDGFHDVIGQSHDAGWDTQLRNEGFGRILAARTWRLPLISLAGLETDAVPALTAAAGNLRTYARAGVVVRVGASAQARLAV